jgi:hypothetical protein
MREEGFSSISICLKCRSDKFRHYTGPFDRDNNCFEDGLFCYDCGEAWSPFIQRERGNADGEAAVGAGGGIEADVVSPPPGGAEGVKRGWRAEAEEYAVREADRAGRLTPGQWAYWKARVSKGTRAERERYLGKAGV